MASSPRFPLPPIIHKDQQLFNDFLLFTHYSRHLLDSASSTYSSDSDSTMSLLAASVEAASKLESATTQADKTGVEPDSGSADETLPTIAVKGTHPVKNAATKRAAALETVPRTRTRMNMDPEVKQVGGADAGEEEGGVEASGDQVKRKREVDESDEEEVTEQKVEKEDGDEGDSESSGEDAYAFESVEAKLLETSSPAKKKQKKPRADSLTPPPTPKKTRGRASKAAKAKEREQSADEDMDVDNDGEKSSEEPEAPKNGKKHEEKGGVGDEKGNGKGRKKKAATPKKPSTPKPKRAPKAKKPVKDTADSDDATDKRSSGEEKSTFLTKDEVGMIFDLCIADVKWSEISEKLFSAFGAKRTGKNLKRHWASVTKKRALGMYPD